MNAIYEKPFDNNEQSRMKVETGPDGTKTIYGTSYHGISGGFVRHHSIREQQREELHRVMLDDQK